jgi:hypothetical protein
VPRVRDEDFGVVRRAVGSSRIDDALATAASNRGRIDIDEVPRANAW